MGDIFEKLLVINEIISEEELEYYKKLQTTIPQPRHLGEILLEKGLVDEKTLAQLYKAEKQSREHFKIIGKQKKDKKVLEVIQKLGIVRQQELAACIRERSKAESLGKQVFLTDLLIQKGYLSYYLVRKFYRKGGSSIALPAGVKTSEELLVNIPKYLKERFLGKIALKNEVLSDSQLAKCWHIMKKQWPRKSLAHTILEQNFVDEKKLRVLIGVLKQSLPERYPYFHAHVRDTKLARLLVQRNFLTPFRINKCLLKQWEKMKKKEYVPIRTILVEDGYLTSYQFDVVLKRYGELVSTEMPSLFLMPPDEMADGDSGKLGGPGISLLLDEDDLEREDNIEEIEEISQLEEIDEIEEIENVEELVNFEETEAERQKRRPEELPKLSTGFWEYLQSTPATAREKEDETRKDIKIISPGDMEDMEIDDEIEAEAIEVCEETLADLDFDMHEILDEVAREAIDDPSEKPEEEQDKKTQKKERSFRETN